MYNKTTISTLIVLTIIGLCTRSLAAQTDSLKKPALTKGERLRTIDVKHVAIDLQFDWQKKQAYGTTSIIFSPLSPTNRITLDAGMLTISSITLSNGNDLKFTYDASNIDDGLAVVLDRQYVNGEDITIRIRYHTNWVNSTDPNNLGGSNGKGIRFFEPTSTEPRRRKQILSAGEAESNRFWFPSYDSPNDLRTTEFNATVDKTLMVISNGVLANMKENSDGTVTFRYIMNTPYANHLTSFVVGEYNDVKQHHGGVVLHNYSYTDEVDATIASVARLPDMVRYFSDLTGISHPYTSYAQVFVQDIPWGLAGAGVSIQTENMVDDKRTHDDFLYLWDALEGESLARQWFGIYLAPRDWSHIWLDKSFARYFSNLYDEYKNGKEEFLLYQHAYDHSVYFFDIGAGIKEPVVNNHYDNADAIATSNYPYYHGASVLHMLRKHMGEDNWRKAVRLYVTSNANKLVTTNDFRKAVEEASEESMEWFFDQWLYRTGHPVFDVTHYYDATKKELTLKVKQTQKPDTSNIYPQVAFFQGKVDIELDNRIERVWLKPEATNTFTFKSAKPPKLVNFDYESTWVKEITFIKSFGELLYQFQNDSDITGRLWAMTALVNLANDGKTIASDKQKIYAAFRNVILSKSYWRLRSLALVQLRGLLAPFGQTAPATLDDATQKALVHLIKNDRSWVRAGAINFLGMTGDAGYTDLYLHALKDSSDRVINAAAIALGKSKSPQAYNALANLVSKPSWKNQSLISALNGLKELGDPRGFDIALNALSDVNLERWSLPTPIWDFRIAAAETIVALGRADTAYPMMFIRFKKSMEENDINVIFNNVLLITTLGDPRGTEVFDLLKVKFKDDENAMAAVHQYESQFSEAVKKQTGRGAK